MFGSRFLDCKMVAPNQNVINPVDKTAKNSNHLELNLLAKNPPGSWVASVTHPMIDVSLATSFSLIPKC